MPLKELSLSVSGDRFQIRKQVIKAFTKEKPGCGKGDDCSKYIYYVETLKNDERIYLKRPAALNKGLDFTVHVENAKFRKKWLVDMPSHKDIVADLKKKKKSDPLQYDKFGNVIDKIYNCIDLKDRAYRQFSFEEGIQAEALLKTIKWLFIEQNLTYWNWSGRSMLYSGFKKNKLV